jgi:hypothetical protein
MGYTHHWDHNAVLDDVQQRELIEGAKRAIDLSGVKIIHEYNEPGVPPELTLGKIVFNGHGDDGHETFWLDRNDMEWTFCKTARKPYDVVVTAVLAYLDSIHPAAYVVSSDGGELDWQAGVELARKAWPAQGNQIIAPRAVRAFAINASRENHNA